MDQRIIVELKNIEGRSHKEIAEFLGISVTAAKVRLHRAHQKLRQILEEVAVSYTHLTLPTIYSV